MSQSSPGRGGRKHLWFWITLFVLIVLLLGSLATGWYVVIFHNYQEILELARRSLPDAAKAVPEVRSRPWLTMALGTLGFALALSGIILFFVRLLREMRLTQFQSDFLARMSHELKTPIATLELSSSLLREGGLSADETERLWASHDEELRRLKEELEALIEAARWQSNSVFFKRKRVALEDWLGRSWGRWQSHLGDGSRLVREGAPLPGEAWVDARLLNLIMDNLIDNARKFARDSRAKVVIRTRVIESTRGAPRWQLEVEDQGWGFDPEEANHIFRRFYRSRTEAPYAISGTGLGLYLAQSAGRVMGISLRGESAGPGQGARFILEGSLLAPLSAQQPGAQML